MEIDQALDIEDLRARFVEHSRQAYRLLPPLEARIRAYRKTHGDAADAPKLAEHEGVVASIKRDPGQTDCGIYLVQKRG